MALLSAYLDPARFPGIEKRELVGGSLYRTFDTVYGVELVRAESVIEAVHAGDDEAVPLAVGTGAMVLRADSVTYDRGGRGRGVLEGPVPRRAVPLQPRELPASTTGSCTSRPGSNRGSRTTSERPRHRVRHRVKQGPGQASGGGGNAPAPTSSSSAT